MNEDLVGRDLEKAECKKRGADRARALDTSRQHRIKFEVAVREAYPEDILRHSSSTKRRIKRTEQQKKRKVARLTRRANRKYTNDRKRAA